ncbi:MAG: S-layer homology domain-containing protein, partial [Bacillota bacterium]
MRRTISIIALLAMLLTMFPYAVFADARSDALENLESTLDAIHDKLDDNDKHYLCTARENLQDKSKAGLLWKTLLGNSLTDDSILTTEVVNRLGNGDKNGAKDIITGMIKDAANIYYSDNLSTSLSDFEDKWDGDVKKLFNNQVSVSTLYQFYSDVMDYIKGNIGMSDVKAAINGDYSTFIDNLENKNNIVRKAIEAAEDKNTDLKNALGQIGWSIDLLVKIKENLSSAVDPGKNAEKALAKGYIRSQLEFGGPTSIKVNETKDLSLKVKDFSIVDIGSLVDWYIDPQYGELSKGSDGYYSKLTAKKAGTVQLVAYRNDKDTNWLWRGEITIDPAGTGSSGGGGGGAATSTPPTTPSTPSDQANQQVQEKLGNLQQDIAAGKLTPAEAAKQIGETVKELAGKSVAADTKKVVLETANKVLEKAGALAAADVQAEVKDNKSVVTVATAAIERQIAQVTGVFSELAAQLSGTSMADLTGKLAKRVVLTVPAAAAGKELAVQVPGDAVAKLQQAGVGLLVKAADLNVSLPPAALSGLNLDAGQAVQLEAKPVQVTQAPPAANSALSTQQVWELDLQVVDKASGQAQAVQSFGQKVRVVLSYDPVKVKDPEILGVYRYNAPSGQWDYVGGRVNLRDNTIAFGTGHFSLYGVMAYEKSFADMAAHWAKREVSVMAARHIARGVAADKFAPENKVTRAE